MEPRTTAWEWENFGGEWVSKLGEEDKKRWERVRWQEAAERYRQHALADHSTMRVMGMPEPVSLEGIFTDAYILDRPTAWQRHNIEELQQEPGHLGNAKRLPGLEVVRHKHRLFILGKPGAGKTTFLKYVALSAARGKLDFVPIFVSLHAWANSGYTELFSYIVQEFTCCGFPDTPLFVEALLKEGKGIILFDGLDEVPEVETLPHKNKQRFRLLSFIDAFGRQYNTCPCLITCRTAVTELVFEPYAYMEIAEFDYHQIKTYISKWFYEDEVKYETFTQAFYSDENRGLRDLARVPLLLGMLCLAFDETSHFPTRRADLYEEALNALLQRWDSTRGIKRDPIYKMLSPKRKRQMFARIAHATFERGDYFLREETLARQLADYLLLIPPVNQEEDVDGKAVLKAIEAQHGILIERARGIYSFSHLTFQEYFTAQYIVENVGKNTLHELTTRITDRRWREVLILTASLLDDADDFFAFFSFQIHNLIGEDTLFGEALAWATRKAATMLSSHKQAALRSFHLARTLERTLQIANDHNSELALARTLTRDLFRDLDRNLAQDIDLAFDLDLELGFEHTHHHIRALTRDLDLALDLVQRLASTSSTSRTLGLRLDMHLVWGLEFVLSISDMASHTSIRSLVPKMSLYFEVVQATSMAFPGLHQSLTQLSTPAPEAPREAWATLAADLRTTLIRERDIGHQWKWTEGQLEQLNRYLRANILLLECLALASIAPERRAAIEDNLLLPPGHPAP